MDPRLLEYYDRELQYIREIGGEFALEFPKIAGRLGLDGFECADPYVERLLEGFAFLAARVQLKVDAEFPPFHPAPVGDRLSPLSFADPVNGRGAGAAKPNEGALADGFTIPRGSTTAQRHCRR